MDNTQFEKMVERYKRQMMEMAAKQPKAAVPLNQTAIAAAAQDSAPPAPALPAPSMPQAAPREQGDAPVPDRDRSPAGQPQQQSDGSFIQQGSAMTRPDPPVEAAQPDPPPSDAPSAAGGQASQPPEQNSKEAGPDPTAETMTYAEFLERNKDWGSLKVQVFTGRMAVPVSAVQVSVDRSFSDGVRNFYLLYTDGDGIVDNINLPAPDKSLSQYPSSEQPFATYDITVTHPDYHQQVYKNTPVFDGIKSILPVRLIPRNLPIA